MSIESKIIITEPVAALSHINYFKKIGFIERILAFFAMRSRKTLTEIRQSLTDKSEADEIKKIVSRFISHAKLGFNIGTANIDPIMFKSSYFVNKLESMYGLKCFSHTRLTISINFTSSNLEILEKLR